MREEPAEMIRRAQVILVSAAGARGVDVVARLDLSPEAVLRIRLHYSRASGSWLRQIDGFFGIWTKQSLVATDFASTHQPQAHLVAYPGASNHNPDALPVDQAGSSDHTVARAMLDRISTAVHQLQCAR